MDVAHKRALLSTYLDRVLPDEGGLEALGSESLESLLEGVEGPHASEAATALEQLRTGAELDADEMYTLEAIVLPKERPVLDVVQDRFEEPPSPWRHLGQGAAFETLTRALSSVGRVEIPEHPTLPYAGTGFIVGDGLLMTNRHVAELFVTGLGSSALRFLPGQTAAVDFVRELVPRASVTVNVRRVVMVHPYWDMALLEVTGLPAERVPLVLALEPPKADAEVAIMGYPAFSPHNDAGLQYRIFRSVFNVKRLQPGRVMGERGVVSYGKTVAALAHDASTLGGNSGSALLDVARGSVVGLHFAGAYLVANYGVPSWELARDSRVVDAGVRFDGTPPGGTSWQTFWDAADPKSETRSSGVAPSTADNGGSNDPKAAAFKRAAPATTAEASGGEGALELTIPLHLTLRLGSATIASGLVLATEDVAVSAAKLRVEPDPDYENRVGYDAVFLGEAEHAVRVPWLSEAQYAAVAFNGWDTRAATRHLLPYHHFSVCLCEPRRLAYFTAVNIDGRREIDVKRDDYSGDTWHYDPRLPRSLQVADELYRGTQFDRGHLVRRLDPVWGESFDEGKRANDDTFHWTNCAPQHRSFNRVGSRWLGIEDYILKNANNRDLRVSVFSGPVLRDADPPLRGVPVPQEFWKVVVMVRQDGTLSATAYLLTQRELVRDALEAAFVFGQWREFQVSLRELEAVTGLSFRTLGAHDPLAASPEATAEAPRQPLESLSEIVL